MISTAIVGKTRFIGIAQREVLGRNMKIKAMSDTDIVLRYPQATAEFTDADTTTVDYLTGATVESTDSGENYICIADSLAGASLLDTTYFNIDSRTFIEFPMIAGDSIVVQKNEFVEDVSSTGVVLLD